MALIDTIYALCLRHLGRRPNLEAPKGYNDIIQWLKLHDQRAEQITACDKRAVRWWVADKAGKDVLIPALLWPPRSFPCVAKATHDSGSARVIRHSDEIQPVAEHLERRLARPYGLDKGEWAYAMVQPTVLVEQMLRGPIVDYKFHCAHGRVRWVQVIWGRASGKAREAIFLPDGSLTSLHMDEKMVHDEDATKHPGADAWRALSELAERLAEPWRYVRVDLYWSGGRPWFGELTFWPRAGCYRSTDEPRFGAMLDLDLSERLAPIVH